MRRIYYGGRVFAGALPLQEAFVVEDGRFAAVGTDREILALRQPGDVTIPLEGRFVCPGFNDSHMHLLNFGSAMEQCDLVPATDSLEALQEALRGFAGDGEGWILGRGWNQDRFTPATGIPTRQDLDEVSRERPLCIVRCCGHCLAVNTKALELLGIDETAAVPEGGAMDLDPEGKPTGVFRDAAMELVLKLLPVPSREDLTRMIRRACRELNRVGITSCHSDDLCTFEGVSWQEVLEAFQEVKAAGDLTVRVNQQSQLLNPEDLQAFLDRGLTTGSGDERFRIGPLKILGDGSLGARTACLSQSYADAPEERGLALFTEEQFQEMIALANRHGMDAAVHVIGDGILDRVLKAYEAVFQDRPREDHRSGLVHVQLTRRDQLERIRKLNLHCYVQTVFLDYDSHIVYPRAGKDLADTSYAFRTLKNMGLHVSNGTDCPVELPDPMRGVQCAVTRQPLDGSLPPYRREEALTLEEALQSYTWEGAYASYEEDFKGKIAPDMAADFVILSQNPFETPAHRLSDIHPLATFLAGQCVYGWTADIRTKRLEIKPLSQGDREALRGLLTNERIRETYMIPDFPGEEELETMVSRLIALSHGAEGLARGICLEDRLIGLVNDVGIGGGTIELGYCLHPDFWGRGYATEMLEAVTRALFRLGFATVRTGAFSDNAASIRVMEKCGMTRCSFTEHTAYRGKDHICLYYEKKRTE